MRFIVSILIIFVSLSCTGVSAVAENQESLDIIIIKSIHQITSQDIEDINLSYSKQADSFFATIKFRESGEEKLKKALKSNIDNYISIQMGSFVVAMPVPIKTEKAFNPLTVQIDDEKIALKLLKLKSE
jgi:preprotein translocase subunit SecD